MALPISSLYAALLAVLLVFLGYRVTVFRRRHQVGIGMGEDRAMQRAVRVHANAAEYVPMAVVLLALLELQQLPAPLLHAFGGTLLLARILHLRGLGRSAGTTPERFWGTALTFSSIVFMALALLSTALL